MRVGTCTQIACGYSFASAYTHHLTRTLRPYPFRRDPAARRLASPRRSPRLGTVDRARLTISLRASSCPKICRHARGRSAPITRPRRRDQGRPASPAIRDALALHGLDRVFAFPIEAPKPPRPSGPRPRMAAAPPLRGADGGLFAAGPGARSRRRSRPKPNRPTPRDLGARHRAQPEPLLVSGAFARRHSPDFVSLLREHLDGDDLLQAPVELRGRFRQLPSYARGFEKLYTDVGDPARLGAALRHHLPRCERIRRPTRRRAAPGPARPRHDRSRNRHRQPRLRGRSTRSATTITTADQSRCHKNFETIGGYLLLASQHADIAIPHVRAVAYGNYDRYQTNVAVMTPCSREG